MPLYEHVCVADDCAARGEVQENYFSRSDAPPPNCGTCGKQMVRLISSFSPIWLKPLGRYGDPSKEMYRGDKPVIAWRRESTRRADGKPERVELTDIRSQREYCRAEGLIPPDEVGNLEIGSDGKSVSSQGLRGSWV